MWAKIGADPFAAMNSKGDNNFNRPFLSAVVTQNSSHGISQQVSHYRILNKLGKGGMSEVYLAEDTKLNRRVALKFLLPELLGHDRSRKRLIREAKAVASLDHPNICSIYEVD